MVAQILRSCAFTVLAILYASIATGATVALKAVKVNDEAIVPSSSITVQPGDSIEANVFISGWNDDLLGAGLETYQVTFDAFSFFEGQGQGALIPLGWDAMPLATCPVDSLCPIGMPICRGRGIRGVRVPFCTCDGDADCPSFFPTCVFGLCAGPNHNAEAAIFVDTERKDFAHFSFEEIAAARGIFVEGDPALGSTSALSGIGPLDVGQALYGGTVVLGASLDACGLFIVDFQTQDIGIGLCFVGLKRTDTDGEWFRFAELTPLQVLVESEVVCGSATASAVGADPPVGTGMSRASENAIEVQFDAEPTAPGPGELVIYKLHAHNCNGPGPSDDMSGQFDLTLGTDEHGHSRILRILDASGLFEHGKWYRIMNNGTWPGVMPFEVDYRVVVGDANNNGMVQFSDLAVINQAIPTFHTGPTDRNDINGDGFVNFADLALANAYIPTVNSAHPCK